MKIVIIDNNFAVRHLLAIYLRILYTLLGKKVEFYVAANGVEGIGYVYVVKPDLIFIDSTLEKYSGQEMFHFLATNSQINPSRISFLTQRDRRLRNKGDKNYYQFFNKLKRDFLLKVGAFVFLSIGKDASDFEKFTKRPGFRLFRFLATPALRISAIADNVSEKSAKAKTLTNALLTPVWFLLQIVESLLVSAIFLFWGKGRFENITLEQEDIVKFRVKYYPSLLAGVATFLIVATQLFAFGFGGLVFFNYRIRDNSITFANNFVAFESNQYQFSAEDFSVQDGDIQLLDLAGGAPTDSGATLEPIYSEFKPFITTTEPVLFTELNSIQADTNLEEPSASSNKPSWGYTVGTFVDNGISFQLSPDGTNWYFFDGAAWTTTAAGFINSNSVQEVNEYLELLEFENKELFIKVFFISDGSTPVILEDLRVNRSNSLVTTVEENVSVPPPSAIAEAPENVLFGTVKPEILNASWFEGNKIIIGRISFPDTVKFIEGREDNMKVGIYFSNRALEGESPDTKGALLGTTDLVYVEETGEYVFELITPGEDGGFLTAELLLIDENVQTVRTDTQIDFEDTFSQPISGAFSGPIPTRNQLLQINQDDILEATELAEVVENSSFTVTDTSDTADLTPGDGICDYSAVAGVQCSLRAAIEEANALAGADDILFSIGAGTVQTITPGSALPSITSQIDIQGDTETGATCDPLSPKIEIDGSTAGAITAITFSAGADNSTMSGIILNGHWADKILVDGANGVTIQCNYIGTSNDGTTEQFLANGGSGIVIQNGSDGTLVGGTSTAHRNIIGDNDNYGIYNSDSPNTTIQANFIGVDVTGVGNYENENIGIYVIGADAVNNSDGMTIGGNTGTTPGGNCTGACNVINSARGYEGIYIDDFSDTITILGNYIGMGADGETETQTAGVRQSDGIYIKDGDNISIGDGTANGRNVIGGNTLREIHAPLDTTGGVQTVDNLTIDGNYIGIHADEQNVFSQFAEGIRLEAAAPDSMDNLLIQNNVIGGTSSFAIGVGLDPSGVPAVIRANVIGTDATTKTANFTVDEYGIRYADSTGGMVGGTSPADGNYVANQTTDWADGIFLSEAPGSTAQYNIVRNAEGAGISVFSSSDYKVYDNTVYDSAYGIYTFQFVSDAVIERNTVYNITDGGGITIGSDVYDAQVHHNTVDNVATDGGIYVTQNDSYATITNNFVTNSIIGIYVRESDNYLYDNVITGSTNQGIALNNNARGVHIKGNSIFNNGGIGIDLNMDGVSANDVNDGDGQENRLQNFAEPSSTEYTGSGGTLSVYGNLNSAASRNYDIEAYTSTTADGSGFGEGEYYVGSVNVNTTANNYDFSVTPITFAGVSYPHDHTVLTLTTTDTGRLDTSEFSAPVTIHPFFELSAATASDVEATGGNIPTLLVTGVVQSAATVDVNVTGGTATGGGTDYTLASTTVTVPVGTYNNTAIAIPLTIDDDALSEGDETIEFNVSTTDPNLYLSDSDGDSTTQSTHTYTITDDEVAATNVNVEFSSATYSAAEDSTTVNLVLSLSGDDITATGAQTVDIDITGGTATGGGTDYTFTDPTTVTIPAADYTTPTTLNVPVTLTTDSVVEGDETVTFDIINPSANAVLQATTSTTLTLTEDDNLSVEFSSATYSVAENGTSVNLVLNVSGADTTSSGVETVDIDVTGGTATGGGTDYTFTDPTTVNIPAADYTGTSTVNVSVTIDDDTIVDGDETVTFDIINPSANTAVGATNSTTLTITENDQLSVEYDSATYSVSESGGTVNLVLTVSGGDSTSLGAQTIDVDVTGGTATGGGTDYTFTDPTTVNIPAADYSTPVTINVPVTIVSDTLTEGDETVTFDLINPSSGNIVAGTQNTSTLTITGDDALSVQYDSATYSVSESGGSVNLVLSVSGGDTTSFGAVTIDVDVTGGTATGGGTDYTFTDPTTVNIPAADYTGTSTINVPVTITSDTATEGDETVTFDLINPSSAQVAAGAQNTTTLTITGDDALSVQYDSATYSVSESGGSVNLVLEVSGGDTTALGATTIDVDVTGGTATGGGTDYTFTDPTTVNIPAADYTGTSTINVPVTITSDTITEGDETVTFDLINPSSTALAAGAQNTSTLTITGDDPLSVQFDSATYSGSESAGTINLVLEVSGGDTTTLGAQSIDVDITGGTATGGGTDYTFTDPTTVNIPAADYTGTVTINVPVTITSDTLTEGDETITFDLINPSSAAVAAGAQNTSTMTITGDDGLSVQYNSATFSGSESAGTINLVLEVSGGDTTSLGATTIDVDITGGTATGGGTDYTFTDPTTVTIPAADYTGTSTINVPITITSDTLTEGDETITVDLINPSANVSVGGQNTSTLTITGDDGLSVQYNSATYSGSESAGTINLVLEVSGGDTTSFGATTVDVDITGGTATGGGTDYTFTDPTTVNIPAADYTGTSTINVPVTITSDTITEGDETITFDLINPSAQVSVGAQNTSTMTITGDDGLSVQFNSATFSGSESAGTINLVLEVSGGDSTALGATTIDVDVTGGTATGGGTDYTFTDPTTVNIPGADYTGTVTINVPVTITSDTLTEGDETITFDLINPSSGNISAGAQNTSTMTITGDDALSVQFNSATFSGSESAGTINLVLEISGGDSTSFGATTIDVDVTGGTATGGGTDYTFTDPTTVNIPAADYTGTTTINVPVTITSDTATEGDETVTFDLINPSSAQIAAGAQNTSTLTITGDDQLSVEFTSATYSAAENAGTVDFVINVTGGDSTALGAESVDIDITGGTATGGGTDYTFTDPTTVTIPAADYTGGVTINSTVTLNDDSIVDGDETVTADLINASGNTGVGATSSTTLTITENDQLSVEFTSATYSVAENGTSVDLVLNVTGADTTLSGAESVDVDITGGTATGGGTDYTYTDPTTVTIPAADYTGGVTINSTITITDDSLTEGNETITADLINPSANTAVGATNSTTVTITDNDQLAVEFNSATFSVSESGGTVNLVLSILGGDSTALGAETIDVDITGGTATGGGTDYTFTDPTTVTIPAGDYTTAQTINVPVTIIADTLTEGDETVTFDVINPSANAAIGTQTSTTLTITGDDGLTVDFDNATYSVAESGGTVNLVLQVIGGNTTTFGAQTVDVDVTGGTATGGGTDYTFTDPTTVTIPAADYTTLTTINVPVTIVEDTLTEGTETVTFDVINPAAQVTVGGQNSSTLSITGNDQLTAEFSSATYSVAENGTSVDFVINVTGGDSTALGAESIDVDITGGTATNGGTDYTYTDPTTITIPAADYTGTVAINSTITIVDDSVTEADETITADLINPSANAAVGATSSTTTTITDNDDLTTEFTSATYSVAEGGGTVNLVLNVTGADTTASGVETIEVDVTGGTATGGSTDYTFTDTTTVNIPAADYTGGVTINVPVTIDEDTLTEGTETVTFDLINPSGNNAVGAQNNTTLTITDNDQLNIEFDGATYTVGEGGGSINFVLEVTGGDSTALGAESIDIDVTGGTATGGGADYTFADPTTVVIPGADYTTTQTINVSLTVNDDGVIEGNETIIVDLINPSTNALVSTQNTSTVTITDDDVLTATFNSATYTVSETGGTIDFVVSVSGANTTSSGAESVDIDITGGTATGGGTDYTFTDPTTITIPAADYTGGVDITATITIVNDSLVEADETITADLVNASSANVSIAGTTSSTVTITNDDQLSAEFSSATYSVAENGTSVDFVINVSGADTTASGAESIDIDITGGSATGGGTDYTFTDPTTVTIPAADYTGTVAINSTLTLNDDGLLEGSETVTADLINPSANTAVGGTNSTTLTITDNENLDVQFTSATYTAFETGGTIDFVINVTGADTTSSGAESVDIDITGGTATGGGTDYTFVDPTTVTIPAADYTGGVTLTSTVTITNDSLVEGNETITADLINGSGNVVVGATNSTTVTIVSDDQLSAEFTSATYSVAENGTSVDFVINVTGADTTASGAESIDIDITGGSATGGGTDYTFVDPTTVTIPAADYTGGVTINSTVTITDDSLVEGSETVTADLVNASANTAVGAQNTTTLTITDNDSLSAEFTSATYTVSESGGTIDFVINVTGADTTASGAESIDIDITGGTATGGGVDYTFTDPTTVTIPAADYTGGVTITSTLTIVDDNLMESDETVTVDLINPSGNVAVGGTNSSTLTITNDETLDVQFNSGTFSGSEGSGTIDFVLTITGADTTGSGAESVDIDITGGTATGGGGDYTFTDPTTVTIPAADYTGGVTINVPITVVADNEMEADETVTADVINPSGNVTVGGTSTSTLTITNEDTLSVQFDSATYSVAENGTSVNLVLEVSGADSTAFGAQSIDVDVTGGSATGGGTDYTFADPTTVAIPAADYTGTSTINVAVTIDDDSLVEGNETVDFDLINAAANTGVGAQNTSTLTITDNDSLSVEFSSATYSVAENGGTVDFVVNVSGADTTASGAESIDIDITGGTATSGGTDYTYVDPTTINIPAADYTGTVAINSSITITDDSLVEGNETITADLINPSGNVGVGATSSTTTTINDNDTLSVEFTSATYTAFETGGTIDFVVNVTGADTTSSGAESIDIDITGGTATGGGTDYTFVDPTTVTIPAADYTGGVTLTSTVTITDDGAVEGSETITADLINPSGNTAVGGTNSTTVTIIDNDQLSVEFTSATYSAAENAGTVDFVINVTGADTTVSGAESIDIDITGGTATNGGTDYTFVDPTTVTIPAADYSGGVTINSSVTITDDSLVEGSETITADLINPSANTSVGAQNTTTTTITDNDNLSVEFSSATYTAFETGGTIDFVINVSGADTTASGAEGIDIDITGGSATGGGTDYTFVDPTTINIPAADYTGTVAINSTVTITDDSLVEGSETITADLINPTANTVVGGTNATTITVVDNDQLSVEFSSATYSAAENAGTVDFVVNVSGADTTLSGAESIDIDITGGTATGGGTDYTFTDPTTITIPAADYTGTVAINSSVTITDDSLVEPSETITADLINPSGNTAVGAQNTTTTTITDNDDISVEFTSATYTAFETGGTIDFVVNVTGADTTSSGAESIDIDITGGTATGGGTDYTYVDPTTVTIPAADYTGGVTLTSTVTITNDSLVEADETITADLINPSAETVVGAQNSTTITIVSDDRISAEFTSATYTIAEGGGSVDFVVNVTGADTSVSGAESIDIDITGGTATNGGTDYTFVDPTTITIPAADYTGGVTFNSTITITDDSLVEPSETITADLINASANTDIGATNSTTTTITDNDDLSVEFSSATYTVAENGGSVDFVINVSGADTTVAGATSIDVDITGGTATSGGTDYTYTDPTTVTIPAADYTGTVAINSTVTIVEDSLIEGSETITADLINPSADVVVGAQNTTTTTITDNDNLSAEFTSATYTAFETGGTLDFVVNVSGADSTLSGAESIDIDITGGSATGGGTDYTFADPTTITIPAADYTGTVAFNSTVTITDDSLVEADETITADLINATANTAVGAQNTTTMTVVSDDALSAEFSSATYTVGEAGGTIDFVVNVSGADSTVSGAESIDIDITGGTATGGGTDYTFADPTTVAIPAADYTGTVAINATVTITDDSLVEADETITADLINASANTNIGATNSTTTTITDNDDISVEFSSATYTVGEAGGTVDFVVNVSGADTSVSGAESIDIDITGGTATNGADYTYTDPTTITIPAADYTGTVGINSTITVNEDLVIEGSETITADLINNSANTLIGATNSTTTTITDNDNLSVQFDSATYTTTESGSTLTLNIEVSGADSTLSGAENVDVDLTGGTATLGTDFTFVDPTTFTIPAADYTGTAILPFVVTLIDDSFVEPDETILFDLINPSANTVLGAQTSSTSTVTSADELNIEFTSQAYSVAEGAATFDIIVEVSGADSTFSGPDSVDIDLTGGTATNGDDYTFTDPTTLAIPSADYTTPVQFLITFTLLDDSIFEPDEDVTFSLISSGTGYSLGTDSGTTLTITNDDSAGGSQDDPEPTTAPESDGDTQATPTPTEAPTEEPTEESTPTLEAISQEQPRNNQCGATFSVEQTILEFEGSTGRLCLEGNYQMNVFVSYTNNDNHDGISYSPAENQYTHCLDLTNLVPGDQYEYEVNATSGCGPYNETVEFEVPLPIEVAEEIKEKTSIFGESLFSVEQEGGDLEIENQGAVLANVRGVADTLTGQDDFGFDAEPVLLLPFVPLLFVNLASNPAFLVNSIPWLMVMRRRRWGRIYDSISGKPVAFANLILKPKDDKLKKKGVKDKKTLSSADGSYRFKNVEPGTYLLVSKHPQYFERDVEIEVVNENSVSDENVAMAERNVHAKTPMVYRIRAFMERVFRPINQILFVLGFIFSTIVFLVYPTWFNLLIFSVYVIQVTLQLYYRFKKTKLIFR